MESVSSSKLLVLRKEIEIKFVYEKVLVPNFTKYRKFNQVCKSICAKTYVVVIYSMMLLSFSSRILILWSQNEASAILFF